MDTTSKNSKLWPLLAILPGLLTLQLVWLPKKTDVEQRQYEDKINLALRQTGHRLMKNAGDTASAIAPVRRLTGNEFVLELKRSFNYDSLPVYLQAAFGQYGIPEDYLVSVKDCEESLLLLGFARTDVEQNKPAPCGGREQHIPCSNIHVVFTDAAQLGAGNHWLEKWLSGGILFSLAFLVYSFIKQKKNPPRPAEAVFTNVPTENLAPDDTTRHQIRFGNSVFDIANQTVQSGTIRQELTFRESKLLHLFCKNINQLLDRNFILQEVWEDEGVIVGRSLDVFVSRLRKILKNDEAIKITSVHGVGYRFEVAG